MYGVSVSLTSSCVGSLVLKVTMLRGDGTLKRFSLVRSLHHSPSSFFSNVIHYDGNLPWSSHQSQKNAGNMHLNLQNSEVIKPLFTINHPVVSSILY